MGDEFGVYATGEDKNIEKPSKQTKTMVNSKVNKKAFSVMNTT